MKISCGTDIIEIERIKEAIEKTGGKFINEIYTPKEIAYCESKKNAKYEHYAARFAAKEAVFKAVVINQKNGKPQINWVSVNFPQIESMDISISHCKKYASANVTILYKEK